jgi:hypothetical protein
MFQITHSIPGAGDAVQCAQDVDAENHYAARLQAHITGCSVAKLRVLATAPSKQDIKNPAHSAKVTAQMKNLISELLLVYYALPHSLSLDSYSHH